MSEPRLSKPLTLADVQAAIYAGLADFLRQPLLGLFFGGVYALGGLALCYLVTRYRSPWLIIPLAIGFPLIGPFVAAGLYETSRRLSRGLPISWSEVLSVVYRQSRREMGWMAFVVLFVFWIWMYQARLIFALFIGYRGFGSVDSFLAFLSTGQGLTFLAVGTLVGGILATILFSLTVIAMPMLLDRDVDFVTALISSVRTVAENPVAMLGFGLIVAVLTFAAMLPMFLGLFVVLPVLGHAAWHLYERANIPRKAA
ncbi:MAG: DUF2189 domain-containing protein [Rhizobiales bacterium]|nr:DUF2189 domain-containing protein [Hyphomicrobiales bacterium]